MQRYSLIVRCPSKDTVCELLPVDDGIWVRFADAEYDVGAAALRAEVATKALRALMVAVELLTQQTTGVVGLQRKHVDPRHCPWSRLLHPLDGPLGAALLEASVVLDEADGVPLPALQMPGEVDHD